jgi:hypothetical protein
MLDKSLTNIFEVARQKLRKIFLWTIKLHAGASFVQCIVNI